SHAHGWPHMRFALWFFRGGCVGLVVALLGAAPVTAHHSHAMFDSRKSLELKGTVRLFQWANPHCWIQLLVPGESGSPVEWSIEMGSPTELYRSGWRPRTLQPGERVTVVVHPARDGSNGAGFVAVTREDGAPVGQAAVSP